MSTPAKQPVYLFADSQLLFWKPRGKRLLEGVIASPTDAPLAAAYIGASNGDREEFYSIFEAAMDAVGITERRMIRASFGSEDREFMERAQLLLLAGGDVQQGWSTFEKTGMKQQILDRYAQGATLVGVSAGAVQLGRRAVVGTEESASLELIDVFNLVPALIDVHDERREWARLSRIVHMLEGTVTGLGIPTGGGIVAHPDGTLEALRRPVDEFSWDGTRIKQSILLPTEKE
jgi:cyanophycinase-like exopeptidase